MRTVRRALRTAVSVVAVFLAAALVVLGAPALVASPYPPAPEPGSRYLSALSAPTVSPGDGTRLSFVVSNPTTNETLAGVLVTFAVYAFNGYPGDASTLLPVANAPALSNATSSGPRANVSVGTLGPGASYAGSVGVVTSAATPAGTFAIRTAVSFSVGPTPYRMESRGWFSEGAWQNATLAPNGTGTVNLSRLNVSGIVPETAVLVRTADWSVVLDALLATGLVLIGVGAYVYFRRTGGPSSRSGTR